MSFNNIRQELAAGRNALDTTPVAAAQEQAEGVESAIYDAREQLDRVQAILRNLRGNLLQELGLVELQVIGGLDSAKEHFVQATNGSSQPEAQRLNETAETACASGDLTYRNTAVWREAVGEVQDDVAAVIGKLDGIMSAVQGTEDWHDETTRNIETMRSAADGYEATL